MTPALAVVETALDRAARGELLAPADLMEIFGIKASQYTRLHKAGAFDGFKVKPAIGRRCFSGALVLRYVHGEPLGYASTFGEAAGALMPAATLLLVRAWRRLFVCPRGHAFMWRWTAEGQYLECAQCLTVRILADAESIHV